MSFKWLMLRTKAAAAHGDTGAWRQEGSFQKQHPLLGRTEGRGEKTLPTGFGTNPNAVLTILPHEKNRAAVLSQHGPISKMCC